MSTPGALDERFFIGTDVAGFCIFHPEDLAHRTNSPLSWEVYGFACRPEFEAGRFLAFVTGSDGVYDVRVTTGPLSDRERQWKGPSAEFRMRVRHGRLLLNNHNQVPCGDYVRPVEEDDCWFDLPNGDYRATVNAIDWASEPGAVDELGSATKAALCSYVVTFERVASIDDVSVDHSTGPQLLCDRHASIRPGIEGSSDHFEAQTGPLARDSYMLLEGIPALAVPGFSTELVVPDDVKEALLSRQRIFEHVVLAPTAAELGDVLVLTNPNRAHRGSEGPWKVGFRCIRLVRLLERYREGSWEMARVAPVERPQSEASESALNELKSALARFAAVNEAFRQDVKHPEFEIGRVGAMRSAESVTSWILEHVRLPGETRDRLLQSSDAARIHQLCRLLDKP